MPINHFKCQWIPYDPAIPLEGIYQKRNINLKIHNDLNDVNVYNNSIEGLAEDERGFFTYEASYERYNCGKYLSIVANQYIHLGNGRPRNQKKCYVIDAENNDTVTLVDIFANKIN